MIRWIRAHYDGKVIVPDEPVDLPVNAQLRVPVQEGDDGPSQLPPDAVECRLRGLSRIMGVFSAPPPPPEALRRENIYDERV